MLGRLEVKSKGLEKRRARIQQLHISAVLGQSLPVKNTNKSLTKMTNAYVLCIRYIEQQGSETRSRSKSTVWRSVRHRIDRKYTQLQTTVSVKTAQQIRSLVVPPERRRLNEGPHLFLKIESLLRGCLILRSNPGFTFLFLVRSRKRWW